MRLKTALLIAAGTLAATPAAAIQYVGAAQIQNGVDRSGFGSALGANIFGGFGSDLVRRGSEYYGLTDRGPGGGTLDYAPRVQVFGLQSGGNGAATGVTLNRTIVFTQADGTTPFTGLSPANNGNSAVLGRSFDPEGLVVNADGSMFVSDEYGPSVYRFDANGRFQGSFAAPSNLVPRSGTTVNYDGQRNASVDANGNPVAAITSGRQDNRGYEGLALSNDGSKLYAVLQDPLVNEGAQNDGRRSQNVRIVEYNTATGESTAQYIYTLDSIAQLNAETPGAGFSATNQGRNIGVSSLVALPNGKFMILERDNRGWGVEDPTASTVVASKRLYQIDFAGADNVANVSLAGTNTLPTGIDAVSKSLFLDIKALVGAAAPIVEKMEGFSFSDVLGDGGRYLYVISDNDYSITQTAGTNVQTYVCVPSSGGVARPGAAVSGTLDAGCPTGTAPIPTYLYTFKLSAAEAGALGFSTAVPEPATWATLVLGFGIAGVGLRRRRRALTA